MDTRSISEKLKSFGQVAVTRTVIGLTDGVMSANVADNIVRLANINRAHGFIDRLLITAVGGGAMGAIEGLLLGSAYVSGRWGHDVKSALTFNHSEFAIDPYPDMLTICCKVIIGALTLALLTRDETLVNDIIKDVIVGTILTALYLSPWTHRRLAELSMNLFKPSENVDRPALPVIEALDVYRNTF